MKPVTAYQCETCNEIYLNMNKILKCRTCNQEICDECSSMDEDLCWKCYNKETEELFED